MPYVDKEELAARGIDTPRELTAMNSENMPLEWQRQFVVRGRIFDAYLISEEVFLRRRAGAQPVAFGGR